MLVAAVHRRVQWCLFALALAVYIASADGTLTTTDAVVSFELTRSLVEDHGVALPGNMLGLEAHRGADGRYYSPFGLLPALYNIPFFLAGQAVVDAGLQIGRPDSLPKALVAMGQTLVVAFLVVQIFRTALLVATPHAALMAALTCAFGSLLWPYALFGFNQPLAAVTLISAIGAVLRGVGHRCNRALYPAGVWMGLGLLTRHELALAVGPIALCVLMATEGRPRQRIRRVLPLVPGVGVALAIWLTYNYMRFGNPFDSGFLRDSVPGFGSPVLAGLAGLLFSPGASIFLYSPFAVLGMIGLAVLYRRDRTAALLLGTVSVMFLVFYASLGNWLGGRSYGGRYLLVLLPPLGVGWAALLDSLLPSTRLRTFAVVTGLGALVQLPGVLIDYSQVSQAAGARTALERQWSWQAAPIVLNTRAVLEAIPANAAYVAGMRPRPVIQRDAGTDQRGFWEEFDFSLDFWWLYLFYLDLLRSAALATVVALLTAAIVLPSILLMRLAAALPVIPPNRTTGSTVDSPWQRATR